MQSKKSKKKIKFEVAHLQYFSLKRVFICAESLHCINSHLNMQSP